MTSTVRADRLLNTQKGTLGQVEVERTGTRQVQLPGGRTVEAEGYVMRGDIDTAIWYDADGRWVALAFDAKGERITYHLIERGGYVPTRPPQAATAQQAPGAG